MAFGTTFAPTAANQRDRTGSNGGTSPRSKLQEAIKVLSLRLPKVLGAQALAPGPLLTGMGSGGMNPDKAMAMNMQQQMPAPLSAQAPVPTSAPPPMRPSAPMLPSQPSVSGASGGSSPAQQAIASMAKSPSMGSMPSAPPAPKFTPGVDAIPPPTPGAPQPPPENRVMGATMPDNVTREWQLPAPPSPTTAPEPPMLTSQQSANEQIGTETDYARLLELIRLANENPYEVQA